MANLIDDAETIMGELIILGAMGLLIWIAFRWGSQKTAAIQPASSPQGTIDSLTNSIWGPSYVPPSTGSVPDRINGALWGDTGAPSAWDQIVTSLKNLFSGEEQTQTANEAQSIPGAAPAGLSGPLSFGAYAGSAGDMISGVGAAAA